MTSQLPILQSANIPADPVLETISSLQESVEGLYVSLSSFLGFNREFVELHYQKTREPLYLHIKKTKKVARGSTRQIRG